jgi:hypothetical protein
MCCLRLLYLNNDGIDEITGLDTAYGYLGDDSIADSQLPLVILSYDETQAKFILSKESMLKSPISRDQLEQFRLKFTMNP